MTTYSPYLLKYPNNSIKSFKVNSAIFIKCQKFNDEKHNL